MIGKILNTFLEPAIEVVDKYVEDKDKANELKSQIHHAFLSLDEKVVEAQASAITAEANGESWLQRNWRPLLMLWFAGLVGAHWLGFTAPNISDDIVSDLLAIVQVGVGGYVLGRSGEKMIKEWKK